MCCVNRRRPWAEANAAQRAQQLEEVNKALDALQAASNAARTAQMNANGVGLAEGAKPPTAEEVAAALELANAKRKEARPTVYSHHHHN